MKKIMLIVVCVGLALLAVFGSSEDDEEKAARREAQRQRHRAEKLEGELSLAHERKNRAEERPAAAQQQARAAAQNARDQQQEADAERHRAQTAETDYTVAFTAAGSLGLGVAVLTLVAVRQVRQRRCLARLMRWMVQGSRKAGETP